MSWRAVPTSAAVFATILAFPVASWSAVPRVGNTFSPRTGAEILEAATLINQAGSSNAAFKATIELAAQTYFVSGPIVLSSPTAPTVVGPADNHAVITNTGTPGTLLQLSSQFTDASSGVSNVDFSLSGTPSSAVSVVELQRGGQLRDSIITVPSSASTATGLRLSPSLGGTGTVPAVAQRVQVQSSATSAPGVRATNGGQLLDSTVTGGAPALDIAGDASGADLGDVTVDSTSVSSTGTGTGPLVRVRAGGNHLRAVLWSTSVTGTASSAAQLIDIAGPTATTGALEAEIGQVSLRGTASSTGVRVRPGSGTAKLSVRARGLLSLGSQIAAVDCLGSASAQTEVTVTGVYRVGPTVAGSNCSLAETDRRTGQLAWRDEANGDLRPVFDSPLVDGISDAGIPSPAGVHDLAGRTRFSPINGGLPGDIGALEYQLTPPENVTARFVALGNRGLVGLVGEATDPDELEQTGLTFQWEQVGGFQDTGPAVLHRFASSDPQQVKLTVTDVTGVVSVSRTVTVRPVIRLDEPATDENPDDLPADPGDPPDPTDPVVLPFKPQVIPETPTSDTPVATTPEIDPSLKQVFPPIIKKVKATSRHVLTNRKRQPEYASPRSGEAAFVIDTWRKSEMALEVSTVLEGKGLTVGLPVASIPLKQFKGRKTLRVGAKIGRKTLKPGLYQMTIAATPRPGAVPERVSFFVRVIRAR